jgi:ABC-type dipeptide/oligopeptide/nickel transport system permease component
LTGYVLRRCALALPLLLGVATLVFSLIHLIPGDPVEVMLGPGAGAGDVAGLRHRLGLDRPLPAQYADFLGGLLRGDLGESLHYHDPVAGLILERYPATLALALASLALALLFALPAGIAAALRPGRTADRLSRAAAILALSMPSFWLGPLLIMIFSIRLDLLPVSGMDSATAVILPAATLAAATGSLLARLVRSTLAEEIGAPYVRACLSRGCSRIGVILRHALRNALPPVITVVALQTGSLLTGAILTETVFAWPGLGRLLVQAIAYRDYPLVQGCVLTIAVTYVAVNLGADLLHGLLEPRMAS